MFKPVSVELEDRLYSDLKILATLRHNDNVYEAIEKAIDNFFRSCIENFYITNPEIIRKIHPQFYKELTRPLTKKEKEEFSIKAAFLEEKIRRGKCTVDDLETYMKIRYRTIFFNPPLLPETVKSYDCTLNLLANLYISTDSLTLKDSIRRYFENTRRDKERFISKLKEKEKLC